MSQKHKSGHPLVVLTENLRWLWILEFHHIVLQRSDFLGDNNKLCVAITSLRRLRIIQRDRAGLDKLFEHVPL